MNSKNARAKISDESQETVEACPGCGMERTEWPTKGHVSEGVRFCCQGCADNSGCTCEEIASGSGLN
jgi:hypothetical protein